MFFSRGMCCRHLFELLLHPLKDKARTRQPCHVVVALVLTQEFALPRDAVLLVLNILSEQIDECRRSWPRTCAYKR